MSLRTSLAALAVVAATTAIAGPAAAAQPRHATPQPAKPTIVLVHGAWADSSSWNDVIKRLIAAGYPVTAFPTPLQTLSGDTAALRTYLNSVTGPVILVGHSYGGAVITDAATGDNQIKALVYIDAFAPDQGQLVYNLPGPNSAVAQPGVFQPVPGPAADGYLTPDTELYVQQSLFPQDLANDLPATTAAVLAATQRPVTLAALTEPSTAPAWKTIPSWYQVGTIDKVIPPDVQLSMARHANAHVTYARTGHLPMVSNPGAVTATIEQAAHTTAP
jgi:pimeloyl-ACP methyl ester carboxylesterase